jgi:HlyD family secretion protein
MSSNLPRVWALASVMTLIGGLTASAQDRTGKQPVAPTGVNVFNPVEGRATVVSSKAEGTLVKKGDLVCALDPAPLKDRLTSQEFIIRGASEAYLGAKLDREVKEIALIEYMEGAFKQDLETVKGEIALAASDMKRAEERLDWSERMFEKGFLSLNQNLSDKLSLQRAKFQQEQAETKMNVLLKYTKDKTGKELQSEVLKAKAAELVKQGTLEREQVARKSLMRQIESCKVVAPAGGRVGYTRPFGAGAVVVDGELLFRIAPDDAPGVK